MKNKINQKNSHISVRTEPETHIFSVGQAVRIKNEFFRRILPAGVYHITATLPPRDGSPQYRVRNEIERHERVTTQDCIEPANSLTTRESGSLTQRTFNHG